MILSGHVGTLTKTWELQLTRDANGGDFNVYYFEKKYCLVTIQQFGVGKISLFQWHGMALNVSQTEDSKIGH